MPWWVATIRRARRSAGSGRRSIRPRRFEVVEQVGHDRAVDAEVLGQGELAPDGALGRGRKDLVAPRAAGKVGHRLVGGLDVGPKDDAQAPPEVVGQCVIAAAGVPDFVPVTRASSTSSSYGGRPEALSL